MMFLIVMRHRQLGSKTAMESCSTVGRRFPSGMRVNLRHIVRKKVGRSSPSEPASTATRMVVRFIRASQRRAKS